MFFKEDRFFGGFFVCFLSSCNTCQLSGSFGDSLVRIKSILVSRNNSGLLEGMILTVCPLMHQVFNEDSPPWPVSTRISPNPEWALRINQLLSLKSSFAYWNRTLSYSSVACYCTTDLRGTLSSFRGYFSFWFCLCFSVYLPPLWHSTSKLQVHLLSQPLIVSPV